MSKRKTFIEMFLGEFCEIVQDYEITTTINLTEEGVANEIRMPMTVAGFVMDGDGEFLFLSQDGEEVTQALPISSIKHIQVIDIAQSAMDQLLEDSDPPEGVYN